MKGYPTTYRGLFDAHEDARPTVTKIEIPIIQRDFAQGRPDDETTAIRERFLDAIVHAATTDASMGLDFVYGDVNSRRTPPIGRPAATHNALPAPLVRRVARRGTRPGRSVDAVLIRDSAQRARFQPQSR